MEDGYQPDARVLVELVDPARDPAAISFEGRMFDRMEAWIPKLNRAIAQVCELVELPPPSRGHVDLQEMSISFSVSFSIEGNVVIGRAGSEGSVEVGCTFVTTGSS